MMNNKAKQFLKLVPAVLLVIAIAIVSLIPSTEIDALPRIAGGGQASLDKCEVLDIDYSSLRPKTEKKEQTLMIYMVGSDLESLCGEATKDIREIINSDIDTEKCNVVIFTGGTYKWELSGISSDSDNIYYLDGKGKTKKLIQVFQSDGLVDTADPTILSFFINLSYSWFPAEQYNLILWDHGGAVKGFGWDEISRNHMGIKGISSALENSPFRENRLGWIAFDACMMATFDVAVAVKNYANYLLASEEPLSGLGLDYLQFGKLTNQKTDIVNAAEVLANNTYKAVADSDIPSVYNTKYDFTLSCIDLRKVSSIQNAMNTLFAKVNDNLQSFYSPYGAFRKNLYEFGSADSDMVEFTTYAKFWEKYFPEETK
ncbi:MAG: hypothetical protein IKH13_03040, partial [Clostridia bacterium]|nr:hypothetical protein [Clostridia bacterium]